MRLRRCGVAAFVFLFFSTATLFAAEARLLRSTSGTRGSVKGSRYFIEDPKTVFHPATDRQVVVHFEWDGAPGARECKASWKDPSGQVVLSTPAACPAHTAKFSMYFSLGLPAEPALGLWAVETHIDGQPAGTHTFQLAAPGTTTTPGSGRRTLPPSEIYARAQASAVTIEALDAASQRLWMGSGFAVEGGLVATAFQVVDGASKVRLVQSSGPAVETDVLAAWNRRHDWALLRAPGLVAPALPLVRTPEAGVGDRSYHLDMAEDGSRTIVESSVVGTSVHPTAGKRLSVAAAPDGRATGGPLLNDYGEVVAIVGGTLIPGSAPLDLRRGAFWSPAESESRGTAVPIAALPDAAPATNARFADLLSRGEFTPPVVGPRQILTATLARGVVQEGVPLPVGESSEFRRQDGEVSAYLTWDPQQKRDAIMTFSAYDADNRELLRGKPVKVKLRPRQALVTTWKLPVATLAPGTYRVDLRLETDVVWRTFFRMVE